MAHLGRSIRPEHAAQQGHPGPFGNILREDWHTIDMSMVRTLLVFARTQSLVQSAFNVAYNNITTSQILVQRPNETSVDAAVASARSRIFGKWGREACLLDAAIGWFVASSIEASPEERADADMDKLPALLNMDRITMLHRMDVYGRHEWKVFEEVSPIWEADSPVPGWRELFDCRVFGTSLPDNTGQLSSRIMCIYLSEWQMYESKKQLTFEADRMRARPPIMTQSLATKHDPNDATSAAHPSADQAVPAMMMDQTDAARLVHAQVRAFNTRTAEDSCTDERPRAAAAAGSARDDRIEIEAGRVYVSNHMAEAPLELNVARQALLESVCLTFGIPMSMLSSGDASGRAKLNSETASPETARIFQEAQAGRKQQLAYWITELCQHVYREDDELEFLTQKITKRADEKSRDKRHKKRKAPVDPDDVAGDSDEDERDGITPAHMRKTMRWSVDVPSSVRLEDIMMFVEKGLLEDGAARGLLAGRTGIPVASFKPSQRMTPDQQLIYGCLPPAPKAPPTAKKKKK